jgi:predicted TIM-barrel fold metal-dependent hydrolase
MEVSGLPPQNLLTYFPELERIAHKVVYGSDWPSVGTIKENIIALEGLSLSEEAKQMIMGQNAARLLKLRFNEQK